MGWPDRNELIGMNLEGRRCHTAAAVVEVEGVDCYFYAAVEEARSRLGSQERAAEEAAAVGKIAERGESRVMLELGKIALGIVLSVCHELQKRVKQYTRWGICWVTRRCCQSSD